MSHTNKSCHTSSSRSGSLVLDFNVFRPADQLSLYFPLSLSVSLSLSHGEVRTDRDVVLCSFQGPLRALCITLQHAATRRNTLQHTATHCTNFFCRDVSLMCDMSHPFVNDIYLCGATHSCDPHCITPHDTATHCSTLQHTATHCNTPHHTATYCNTLHHPAPYCTTL